MNKHEGQQSRAAHSRMRRSAAAWLIISALLTFGSSAGAELRTAASGGVHPGSRTASGLEPQLALSALAPEGVIRPRSIMPISPASSSISPFLDDHGSAPDLDRDSGRRRAEHATVFWGATVDRYIIQLASVWETIREAGDFDFKLGGRAEMKLKLQDLLDNPGALLVVRTAF